MSAVLDPRKAAVRPITGQIFITKSRRDNREAEKRIDKIEVSDKKWYLKPLV